jgi:RNA polymerase sigma-70 factor (ECF subfamily)
VQDPRTDQQLVDAINAGDDKAFEVLYRRHRDWVVQLAYRFTGQRDDALDVAQDAFMYLLGKFPGFRLSAKLTTFLYPAVKHIAIRKRDRSRRHVSDENVPEPLFIPADPGDDLAQVVALLPAEMAETLLLRFVDDMTLDEIAAAMDVPPGTVKSRLHRAIAQLREDERTKFFFNP